MDAALVSPERCPALVLVAPAVFVGEPPLKEKDGGANGSAGGGGGFKLPLDRALRFAWFRFLISQDAPGLNVVRGSVYRQTAAIEEGRMYADLAPEARSSPTHSNIVHVRSLNSGVPVHVCALHTVSYRLFGGERPCRRCVELSSEGGGLYCNCCGV